MTGEAWKRCGEMATCSAIRGGVGYVSPPWHTTESTSPPEQVSRLMRKSDFCE